MVDQEKELKPKEARRTRAIRMWALGVLSVLVCAVIWFVMIKLYLSPIFAAIFTDKHSHWAVLGLPREEVHRILGWPPGGVRSFCYSAGTVPENTVIHKLLRKLSPDKGVDCYWAFSIVYNFEGKAVYVIDRSYFQELVVSKEIILDLAREIESMIGKSKADSQYERHKQEAGSSRPRGARHE